jgi:hypothetical protein
MIRTGARPKMQKLMSNPLRCHVSIGTGESARRNVIVEFTKRMWNNYKSRYTESKFAANLALRITLGTNQWHVSDILGTFQKRRNVRIAEGCELLQLFVHQVLLGRGSAIVRASNPARKEVRFPWGSKGPCRKQSSRQREGGK